MAEKHIEAGVRRRAALWRISSARRHCFLPCNASAATKQTPTVAANTRPVTNLVASRIAFTLSSLFSSPYALLSWNGELDSRMTAGRDRQQSTYDGGG